MKQLTSNFFARDTLIVAQELLGKIISLNGMSARIVETEAYKDDPASHAYKKTDRSALMFDTHAHVYVYLIYGMYYCINFTTENNKPGAVLIRAVEPLTGIEEMKQRRKIEKITNLCSGPGKLCIALGIDKMVNETLIGNKVKILDDGYTIKKINATSRIGIKDALHLKWRFYIEGNEFVSKN